MRANLSLRGVMVLTALLVLVPVVGVVASGDLRVLEAAKRNDPVTVRALVQEGADVNAPYADGATALHWATHWDELTIAEVLIRAEANVNAATDLGVTPLRLACTNRSAAMVDLLLASGADPNAGLPGGEQVVMTAARSGDAEVMKLLLSHGGDANATETWRGQTALMWAASQRHPDVVRVLVEGGADVHARTLPNDPPKESDYQAQTLRRRGPTNRANGFTPLLFAARSGDLESAQILLNAGADVNTTADDGMSALVLATVRAHTEMVTLLLERGADPNADGAGYTALHWAAGSWESELTTTAITTQRLGTEWHTLDGLKKDKLHVVKVLLARGADPDVRLKKAPRRAGSSRNPGLPELEGATPFLLAAQAGAPDVMRALVEAGADVELRTTANGTPLMAAAGLGRVPGEVNVPERDTLAAANVAVDLGADVNATDDVGNAALHYAAYLRRDSIIEFLVDTGAMLEVRNKYEETPLWMAELVMQFSGGGTFQIRRSSTSDLLRERGARASASPYEYSRPTEWPDRPRSVADVVERPGRPQEEALENPSSGRSQR